MRKFTQNYPKFFSTNIFSPLAGSQRRIRVHRSSDFELVMKFPPSMRTKKLVITPNFTFDDFEKVIQDEAPDLKLTVLDSATQTVYPKSNFIIDFLQETSFKELDLLLNDKPQLKLRNKILPDLVVDDLLVPEQTSNLNNLLTFKRKELHDHVAQFTSYYLHDVRIGLNENPMNPEEFRKLLKTVKDKYTELNPNEEMEKELVKRRSKVESSLKHLLLEKEKIVNSVDDKLGRYILAVVLVSLAQLVFFFYTIYYVEWLGWDIMEPITYSIEVFLWFVGIRYFFKYRRVRSFEQIKQLFLQRYLKKFPTEQIKLESMDTKLKSLDNELRMIDIFREINK